MLPTKTSAPRNIRIPCNSCTGRYLLPKYTRKQIYGSARKVRTNNKTTKKKRNLILSLALPKPDVLSDASARVYGVSGNLSRQRILFNPQISHIVPVRSEGVIGLLAWDSLATMGGRPSPCAPTLYPGSHKGTKSFIPLSLSVSPSLSLTQSSRSACQLLADIPVSSSIKKKKICRISRKTETGRGDPLVFWWSRHALEWRFSLIRSWATTWFKLQLPFYEEFRVPETCPLNSFS